MEIKIINKRGIVLKTAGKYIDEDIILIPDTSLFPAESTGYAVILSVEGDDSGASYSYTTDNGLSGRVGGGVTGDGREIELNGVSSISITDIVAGGVIQWTINTAVAEYQTDDFSLNITQNTTIQLSSYM